MVANDLQKALLQEITEILKNLRMKDAAGNYVDGPKGYEQGLPLITEDDEDESAFFPYFIVKLDEGETAAADEPWKIHVFVLFGIYEDSTENIGHKEVLNMIEKIQQRFEKEPLLCGKYRADPEISWALQDEQTYPFYFGAIELYFWIPKIGREDKYS